MLSFEITPESLLALLGVIVSLVFSYFPILRVKFAGLTAEAKSGIMIATLILVTAATFALGCVGVLSIGVACDRPGITRIAIALVIALATNQGTWGITKNLPTRDVKAMKATIE